MRDQGRALQLVEQIYQALVDPDGWNGFLESLSVELGGAAVQLSLRLPDENPAPADFVSYGLDESYREVFIKLAVEGLPWGSLDKAAFRGGFAHGSEVVNEPDVADTPLYMDFMRPQGLAAEWPICHLVATQNGFPMSGVVIFQREGGRAIDAGDFALLDSLVPHLARAYAIHCRLRQTRQETDALNEAVNRLPTGVLLLDAEACVVMRNRSADQILALDDGFSLTRDIPQLSDGHQNRELQKTIQACVREQRPRGASLGAVMLVNRPSGRRPFSMLVSPLLAALPGSFTNEARAIIFVADPDGGQISATAILQSLYQLTHAEAELVRLIAEGCSLERVAETRGVTMNTVRSQLKQVFSKTDTNRQSELVHLVLAGVARVHGHAEERGPGD